MRILVELLPAVDRNSLEQNRIEQNRLKQIWTKTAHDKERWRNLVESYFLQKKQPETEQSRTD